jgi:hypothetical protein
MRPIYHYATVLEALNKLGDLGYNYDYNIHENEIVIDPHSHNIDHIYRYEGASDPADQAVVYGITSQNGQKGVFVAGYSAKTNSQAATVLSKICIESSGQCEI